MAEKNLIGAEFQALPLEFLISTPLVAAVKAQRIAAETTRDFLESMIDDQTKEPKMVNFKIDQQSSGGGSNEISVNAPLLAMVPVPHLRIEEMNINFHFEISQTYRDSSETNKSVNMKVSSGKALSPWVSASVSGSASSKATKESETNRSGQLDISVKATEAPIPEGLARVLSLMTSAIQTPEAASPSPTPKPRPSPSP